MPRDLIRTSPVRVCRQPENRIRLLDAVETAYNTVKGKVADAYNTLAGGKPKGDK